MAVGGGGAAGMGPGVGPGTAGIGGADNAGEGKAGLGAPAVGERAGAGGDDRAGIPGGLSLGPPTVEPGTLSLSAGGD